MEQRIYKVYQTAHSFIRYTADVQVNGQSVSCSFEGGVTAPIWSGGTFATHDLELQKAIEARKDFGDLIVLAYSSEKVIEPLQIINEQIEEATREPEAPKMTVVEGVTNGSQAKKWLATNIEGVTYALVPNVPAILEVATKHLISFPDWKL